MDLKAYYQEIRERAKEIKDPFVLVASVETRAGGRPGVFTEVTRDNAAKMIVERTARLATKEEADSYRKEQEKLRQKAQDENARGKLQLAILSEQDFKTWRESAKPGAK